MGRLIDIFWRPQTQGITKPSQKVSYGLAFAVIYILLAYIPTASGFYENVISFNPWIFYPPAFVRLCAFLVLGFWSVPFIFMAQMFVYSYVTFDPAALLDDTFVAFATSIGAPLGAALAARAVSLKPNLSNLTGLNLLALSVAGACSNALFLRVGLLVAGKDGSSLPHYSSIIVGDTLGTWVVIYVLKVALTADRRWPKR